MMLNGLSQESLPKILEFKNVSKHFGEKLILQDINFTVKENEIVALLGSNGAGKTTAIKMMLGQEIPSSGSIQLFNKNPIFPMTRQCVGLTPQNIEFQEGIKTLEILKFVQGHYKNSLYIKEIIEKFGLEDFINTRANRLSGGQKRRLALALAFIGNPKIVFLDEPTTGLDVSARHMLWDVVKNYAKQGKTILLTTHYLEEIEKIATRVIFLQHTKIHIDGTVENIKKIANSSLIRVSFIYDKDIAENNLEHIESIVRQDEYLIINTYNSDALIVELVKKNINFKNLIIQKESLESAFLSLSKDLGEKK